ncbi:MULTISPECIES: phage tail tape measure protein [Klebsiella pneumoniae complex]|uniref:phage tail tape measure protein n=1 Tax=Klebsiella pneumoniae complex TaxID=3390273 RepID=UPI001FB596C1|nr:MULTISPECIES: phage tail tape measure protein [Klebsiella]MCJ1867925.1 phage tail tape measure protein [Klebsiella quasipneumoniae subsp. similipneumoniae]MDE8940653.1 phage tail tape measure protein [Klebsiella pneumoniae]MDE9210466.1 phage tail tape measure protein [Klebsiella pneumoniae]HBW9472099.1 phage tail tape measure protein [Klebsiella pneumoniae]HDU1494781.1 phage tail tape measure protein [Klebsiella pneumoniae]
MAGKSLGTLTIDLIARTGGFVQGMDKAERSSQKWRDNVKKDAAAVGSALAAVGTAAAAAAIGVSAAGIALVKNTSEQITATDRWAKSLKMSTQDLLSWQFAAEKAGLTGDNIADIFKDINDKVGDAVLNKSGEAAQALDTLGLSAKKLAEQSPDKQLMAISEALQKIPSQAGKTNILESLGNDLSKMLPLFDNNNEKLKQFIQLSKDFGVAPPQEDIDNLVKVNQFFQDIETSARGLKMEIASGLAKVDLTPLQDGLDDIRDVFTDPAVLQGLSDLVGEAISLAGVVGRIAGGLGAIATYTRSRIGAVSGNYNAADESDIAQRIEFLNKRGNQSKEQKDELAFLTKRLQFLRAIKSSMTPEQVDRGAKGLTSLLSDMGIDPSKENDYKLGKNESNQKQPEKKDTSAAKLQNAYKAVEQSYLQQIALVDQLTGKTKDATEVEKLHFDLVSGRLVGINKEQQIRLEGLASEVDKYNALSKFRDLQDELLTPEEKLLKTTKERFEVLKDIQGMKGISPEEYKKAAKAISKASFSDAPKFSGLDPMFGGESGELKKVDDAQKEQEKWYQNQLDLLEQNRQARSDLNEEWDARELELKKKHQDEMNKLDEARNQLMLSSVVDGLGSMVDLTRTAFGEQSGVYKAAFAVQKAAAIAQSVIAIQQGIAMAAANPFPYNLAAMASVAASTAGIVSNIAAVGMAHDGIDAVPETGTWLLQKGERVVTANTSAKLDATLNRVAQQSTSGNQISQEFNFNVNGDPSDAQIAMMKKAAADGAKMGYQKAVNSVITGQGDLHKALMTKTNSGRKIG